jgi:UDP-4-amino-4-deoxy-L-arabinose-oxoglutarate aminotransferase
VSKSATDRHGGTYQHWDLVELGYKANLTDLDAAVLRPQLAHVDDKRAKRARIVARYTALLRERIADVGSPPPSVHGVSWLVEPRGLSSHHLFTVHAPPGRRDDVLARLGEAGIGTAVNYRAIHLLTYLSELLAIPRGALPVAEEIGDRTISLPLHPGLVAEEQDRVVSALAAAWAGESARV